eukprot:6180002-Pleurochrysis_carterae.AAC.1
MTQLVAEHVDGRRKLYSATYLFRFFLSGCHGKSKHFDSATAAQGESPSTLNRRSGVQMHASPEMIARVGTPLET